MIFLYCNKSEVYSLTKYLNLSKNTFQNQERTINWSTKLFKKRTPSPYLPHFGMRASIFHKTTSHHATLKC